MYVMCPLALKPEDVLYYQGRIKPPKVILLGRIYSAHSKESTFLILEITTSSSHSNQHKTIFGPSRTVLTALLSQDTGVKTSRGA